MNRNIFKKLIPALDRRIQKHAEVTYPAASQYADALIDSERVERAYDFFLQQKIKEQQKAEYLRQHPEILAAYNSKENKRPISQSIGDWWSNSDSAEFLRTVPAAAMGPSRFLAQQAAANPEIIPDTWENLKRIGTRSLIGLGKFGTNVGHAAELLLDPEVSFRFINDPKYRKDYKTWWQSEKDNIRNYWRKFEGDYRNEDLSHGANQGIINSGAGAITAIPGAIAASGINAAVEPMIAAKMAPLTQKVAPLAAKYPKAAGLAQKWITAGRDVSGLRPGNMLVAPLYADMLEDAVYGYNGDDYAPFTEGDAAGWRNGFPTRGLVNITPGMGAPARIAAFANDWMNNRPFNTFDYGTPNSPNDRAGAMDQGWFNQLAGGVNPNPFIDLFDAYVESEKNRKMGVQDAAMTQLSDVLHLLPGKYGKILGAVGAVGEMAYPFLREAGVPSPWTYARELPARRAAKMKAEEEKRLWDEYDKMVKDNDFEGRLKRDLGEAPAIQPMQNKPINNPEFRAVSMQTTPQKEDLITSVDYSNIRQPSAPTRAPFVPVGYNTSRNQVPTAATIRRPLR